MGRIIDELDSKMTRLTNIDPDWVTFVTDHIDLIKAECRIVSITDSDKDRFKLKVEHLLRENNCQPEIQWVARLINNLNSYGGIQNLKTLYIPEKPTLTKLYRQYKTSTRLL